MKRFLIAILIIGVIAALLIPVLLKEQRDVQVYDEPLKEAGKRSKYLPKPELPLIVEESAIVCIRDIEGTEVNFNTYASVCKEHKEEINYDGSWLDDIFEYQKVIPVKKKNGVFALVYIDFIDEYYFDGNISTITLLNGNSIVGTPVTDYNITGKSALGEISLPVSNIHLAKFNTEQAKKFIKETSFEGIRLKKYEVGKYWPIEFTNKIKVVTNNDSIQIVKAPLIIYNLSGCDDNYIPCKSFYVWKLTNKLPLKYGSLKTMLNLDYISNIKLSKDDSEDLKANVVLKNNKELTNASVYNGQNSIEAEYCTIVGLIGTFNEGLLYIPITNIKEIKTEGI